MEDWNIRLLTPLEELGARSVFERALLVRFLFYGSAYGHIWSIFRAVAWPKYAWGGGAVHPEQVPGGNFSVNFGDN